MLAANPTLKMLNIHLNESPTNIYEVPIPATGDSMSLNEDQVKVNKAPVRLNEAPVRLNEAPVRLNEAPENENAAPLRVNLANPDDSLITKQYKTQSGKILYCQFCILPANSGGFIIN